MDVTLPLVLRTTPQHSLVMFGIIEHEVLHLISDTVTSGRQDGTTIILICTTTNKDAFSSTMVIKASNLFVRTTKLLLLMLFLVTLTCKNGVTCCWFLCYLWKLQPHTDFAY